MAIAYVGNVGTVTKDPAGTTSVITVGASGVTAGNHVVIVACLQGTNVVSSATDTAGNTYTVDRTETSGTVAPVSIISGHITTGLSSGNTITLSHPSSVCAAIAEEFSGITTSSYVDQVVSSSTGTGTTAVSTGNTATLAASTDLQVCGIARDGAASVTLTDTTSGLSNFTGEKLSTPTTVRTIHGRYKLGVGTAAVSYIGTLSASRAHNQAVVTYKATSATLYTMTPTGTVTPAAAALLLTLKALAGSITPAGALALFHTYGQAFAGAITPAGTLLTVLGKILTGAITPAGALVTRALKAFTGEIVPVGALAKRTSKWFGAGGYGAAWGSSPWGDGDGIVPAGALAKRISKRFGTGSWGEEWSEGWSDQGITPVGALTLSAGVPPITASYSGQVTPAGQLARLAKKVLAGAVTPAATCAKLVRKAVGGTLTPAGALTRVKSSKLATLIDPFTSSTNWTAHVGTGGSDFTTIAGGAAQMYVDGTVETDWGAFTTSAAWDLTESHGSLNFLTGGSWPIMDSTYSGTAGVWYSLTRTASADNFGYDDAISGTSLGLVWEAGSGGGNSWVFYGNGGEVGRLEPAASTYRYCKFTESGGTTHAYVSTTGTAGSWTEIGTGTPTPSWAATCYAQVGLFAIDFADPEVQFDNYNILPVTSLAASGQITPTGALAKRALKAPAGSVTPAGVTKRRANKALSGAIAPSGALSLRFTGTSRSTYSGTITPAGTLRFAISKRITGQITPRGRLCKQWPFPVWTNVTDGSLTLTGVNDAALSFSAATDTSLSLSAVTDTTLTLTGVTDTTLTPTAIAEECS